MEQIVLLPPTALEFDLDAARRYRAELRESISALEQALAAPTPGRGEAWCERVHVALVELSADLRAHVEITVGPDGMYSAVLASAPRLSHAVTQISTEQKLATRGLNDLIGIAGAPGISVDRVRALGTVLLGRLIRLRQRGADLVYEAYHSDIGGED